MDQLKKQVEIAQRRLAIQKYLSVLPTCWFVTFLLAAIGVSLPKLFALPVEDTLWTWSWIGGAAVVGLIAAGIWTTVSARSQLDAAVEIDRRFQLKERVSSMLSLGEQDLETEAGQALLRDATRRIEGIDVRSEFAVTLGRRAWLPLVPAVIAFCLAFLLPNKEPESVAAVESPAAAAAQVKKSAEDLRRKLAEQRKQAEDKGLKDAESIFKRIEEGTRQLSEKKDADKQQAMVKLNDLAKELEKRRNALGGGEQMQKQLNQIKDLKKGPADKLAKAMKDGDFQKALDELKKLQDDVKNSKLNEEQKKQLAGQMEQMKQKMEQAADAHKQAMQEVQDKMKQAQAQGEAAEANKLQQQLDKLAQQAPAMDKMSQMAKQLDKAAQDLKNGSPQDAAKALEQMAKSMENMQKELDEMEMLDQAQDQISQAKDSMNCKECGGGGCKACKGGGGKDGGEDEGDAGGGKQGKGKGGQGKGKKGPPGDGMGEGQGAGFRPEEKNKTSAYDSRVGQTPGKGKAVVTDLVNGPNIKGQVQQEVQAGIEAARREASDPLTGENLPRVQREHAKEYFDLFLKENE